MSSKACIILLIALLAGTGTAAAQDCATALDRAGKSYEAGNFREVIATVSSCVTSLPRDEQWQAYRLAALAHLFLDEAEQADTALLKMLAINPRYRPSAGRDPIELVRPLQAYGSYPRVLVGAKAGLSYTGREITQAFGVAGGDNSVIDHRFITGSDLGLTVDLNLFPSIALSTELLYSTRAFSYTASNLLTINRTYSEQLSWLTIPLLVKYRIGDWSIEPYVYGGYFVQQLLSATSDLEATRIVDETDTVEIANEAVRTFSDNRLRGTQDRRNALNHGIALGGGLLYKLGDGALTFDVRYAHGLAQVVKSERRYTDQNLLFKYLYLDDDFRLRDISVTIGYTLQLSFTTYRK